VHLPPPPGPTRTGSQKSERLVMQAPDHINPFQWHQALGVARQACARVFRDGGSPSDALAAFGVARAKVAKLDWSKAVESIAELLCREPVRRAA